MRFHESVHDVYFDDLDAFQILHNARYLLLFERTIGSFWRHLGWKGNFDFHSNPDAYQVVRANHVEYLRPVGGIGQVRVRVWVEKLGTTSLTFGMSLLPMDQDTPHATGTRVLVKLDPATRQPKPWTEEFQRRLAPYRKDAPAAP